MLRRGLRMLQLLSIHRRLLRCYYGLPRLYVERRKFPTERGGDPARLKLAGTPSGLWLVINDPLTHVLGMLFGRAPAEAKQLPHQNAKCHVASFATHLARDIAKTQA